jgi:hypothetical protein
LFETDDNITPEELQKAAKRIMGRIYNPRRLLEIIINILIHFPFLVFPPTVSIVSFRMKYITKAFVRWKQVYFRKPLVQFGGYIILKKWVKKFKKDKFLESLSGTRAKNSF